ncbi:hypothetical protein Lepto7375DRAFT_0839 [Leptolyngbya sp. PCC 7375]|nr:hypothetical protein Lepto7375DRAFT_0839 [Leptolyngbya sp. PCC 7375]
MLNSIDPDFASILPMSSPGGSRFNDALQELSLGFNKVLIRLIKNRNHIRFTNAVNSLKSPKSEIYLFMPTPSGLAEGGLPNLPAPLIAPTGTRINVGRKSTKVKLYFGHGRFTGRFFGVGNSNSSRAEKRRPHQFFRMDYHKPHSNKETDLYWPTGNWNFHFHVLDKR